MGVALQPPPPMSYAMKRFPPRRAGALIPINRRDVAALGLTMYTASRRTPLTIQSFSHRVVRRLGAVALPGESVHWQPPLAAEDWQHLLESVESVVGRFAGFAVYERRQPERGGMTLLFARDDAPLAVVKVRDSATGIEREQQALTAVSAYQPVRFKVPQPLGMGHLGEGLWWSAQSAVFTRPHRPVLSAGPDLFHEVSEALTGLVVPSDGRVAAHNDLTPWNLRRDERSQWWLFDWEDAGSSLPDADRVYFSACAHVLGAPPPPRDLSPAAMAVWRRTLAERARRSPSDQSLTRQLIEVLDSCSMRSTKYVNQGDQRR